MKTIFSLLSFSPF